MSFLHKVQLKKLSYLGSISNETEYVAVHKWWILNKPVQLSMAETADCPQCPFSPSSH